MTDLIQYEFELVRDLMPVLVTASFSKIQSNMNELGWRHNFPIISLWEIFRCSRALNSIGSRPIWLKFRSSKILCLSLLSASLTKIRSKLKALVWRHSFPHYKSKGTFCCHGNQSFDPIYTKTICSLSPNQVMLHIKFDQDWPTGLRDIQV